MLHAQWGGYTIDPHLFPYPEDTWGDWLHAQGLHMGANLHDATGVYASEATFGAMCKALGLNASATADIPFDIMSSECVCGRAGRGWGGGDVSALRGGCCRVHRNSGAA